MPESKKRVIVDGVEFAQVFQFPRILGAVTAALQPARLALALFMVTALITFGRIWDSLATPTVHPTGLTALPDSPVDTRTLQQALQSAISTYAPEQMPERIADWPVLDARKTLRTIQPGYLTVRKATPPERQADVDRRYRTDVNYIDKLRPKGAFEAAADHIQACFRRAIQGAMAVRPLEVFYGSADIMLTPVLLWQAGQQTFTIMYGVLFLIIFAVGGGALSRMAAVQFTGEGQRLPMRKAIDFALSRWITLILAKALPVLCALGMCLVLALAGGLLFSIPLLDILGGIVYGLALLAGLLVAFLLVGYALGFPLIIPAVVCESSDAMDAVQRSYAYVVGRPLLLIGYWITAKIGFMLGYLLAALMATLTLNITASVVGALTHNPALTVAGGYEVFDLTHPQPLTPITGWHSAWAASAISFWQVAVVATVIAYLVVYFFSASTIVYLLMRKACDGQATDDLWREEDAAGPRAANLAAESTTVVAATAGD